MLGIHFTAFTLALKDLCRRVFSAAVCIKVKLETIQVSINKMLVMIPPYSTPMKMSEVGLHILAGSSSTE